MYYEDFMIFMIFSIEKTVKIVKRNFLDELLYECLMESATIGIHQWGNTHHNSARLSLKLTDQETGKK